MKEAGIEITFRQSFFSDPAVPVKNLKVGWLRWWAQPVERRGQGSSGGSERRVQQGNVDFFFVLFFCF